MPGTIASFICSTDPLNVLNRQAIFAAPYNSKAGWATFVKSFRDAGNANGLLTGKLDGYAFCSLYIASWIYHPVEKGTFMINLSGLNAVQLNAVKSAVEALPSRTSSHLSGKGHSASKEFNDRFLKGYGELLVQYEGKGSEPFLFLKAEGHPLKGVVSTMQHSWGYVKKRFTGEGETANEVLNAVARWGTSGIDTRAAENFGKGYEALVKGRLNLSIKSTIREVWEALYEIVQGTGSFGALRNLPNDQLGTRLKTWVDQNTDFLAGIHKKLPNELKDVGDSLISDGSVVVDRVYRELRITPAQIDAAVTQFTNILNAG